MSHIMNDDVDSAEKNLANGHSPFHQVGPAANGVLY